MLLKDQLQKKIMKLYKIKIFLLIFLNFNLALAKTPDEIIEGKKRAVFLITVYEKSGLKKSRFEGSGFFTDDKGHFVTNLHVLESYIKSPNDSLIQIQNSNGDEFTNIEIEKCGNENKIDLCYGKIITDKKIYFFDVLNRTATKTTGIAIIGHNGDYFSIKKGEVVNVETNVEDKFGIPKDDQENRNTSMIQLGKYEYKSGFCKGDSGSPVFDYLTGDLVGVFTNCVGKKGGEKFKYAIDSKEVYSFISRDSKFTKIKIPSNHIYIKPAKASIQPIVSVPDKGDEFEEERRTGKLE